MSKLENYIEIAPDTDGCIWNERSLGANPDNFNDGDELICLSCEKSHTFHKV